MRWSLWTSFVVACASVPPPSRPPAPAPAGGRPSAPPAIRVEYCGETVTEFPSDLWMLEGAEPVYEVLPGWQTSTAGMRDYAMLPPKAQAYVERITALVGCEVGIVSTGSEREHTIIRAQTPIASWFD